jgi:hypothetical protein
VTEAAPQEGRCCTRWAFLILIPPLLQDDFGKIMSVLPCDCSFEARSKDHQQLSRTVLSHPCLLLPVAAIWQQQATIDSAGGQKRWRKQLDADKSVKI